MGWTFIKSYKVISKCMEDVEITLKKCSVSSSVDPENRSKAEGYLASLNEPVNVFLISFMMDVLSLLDILNKAFQKSDSSLPTSLSILKSVREDLNSLLHKYTIEHITGLIYPEGTVTSRKRNRTILDRFENFLLTEKLPAYRNAKNDLGHLRT